MSTPDRTVRHDVLRVLLLPPALVVASLLLLVLAGFGQNPPEQLPWTALLAFGVLFGDAFTRSLRRVGRRGFPWLAAGIATAAALAWTLAVPQDLVPVAAALVTAALLRSLPEKRAGLVGPASLFVAATVLANYTLDAFLPVGPWFLVNVGTLFFGITFTQRDRIHQYGRRAVYATIAAAAVANVIAAWSVGTPLRYVAVSFLAIIASEAADTEVYQRLLSRRWLTRVFASNAVSAPIDTILFTVLAFAGAPFATLGWMTQVIVTDVIVKYGSGAATALLLLRDRRDDDRPGTGRSRSRDRTTAGATADAPGRLGTSSG